MVILSNTKGINMSALKKTTSIKLDHELDIRLNNLAKLTDRSPHFLMQKAISEFVSREEKIEKFRLETLQAYEEYALTGHYVTHEKADEWLKNLEQGIVTEPPQ